MKNRQIFNEIEMAFCSDVDCSSLIFLVFLRFQLLLILSQFADIAGFTQWSSTRDPEHVFQLLETLYKAFDEIAKRRRVFKVSCVQLFQL